MILALATAALGIGACKDGAGADVGEINENASEYVGKTVTLTGVVDDRYTSGAFVLEGDDAIFEDEVLVIVPKDKRVAADEGRDIRVTGTVSMLNVAEVERDFDLDLTPDLEVDFKNKLFVLADVVTPEPAD